MILHSSMPQRGLWRPARLAIAGFDSGDRNLAPADAHALRGELPQGKRRPVTWLFSDVTYLLFRELLVSVWAPVPYPHADRWPRMCEDLAQASRQLLLS